MKSLCVYCGSNFGSLTLYEKAARDLGKLLAEKNITLVYGGGNVGLMGAIADEVLDCGGKAVGVIPRYLAEKEVAHKSLTKLHLVDSMHERKALMADLSDGFVALPGGFGTFDEICEMITWTQLHLQQKPCAFLSVAGFYDDLLKQFEKSARQGFIRHEFLDCLIVTKDPEELLSQMDRWQNIPIGKWLKPRPQNTPQN